MPLDCDSAINQLAWLAGSREGRSDAVKLPVWYWIFSTYPATTTFTDRLSGSMPDHLNTIGNHGRFD
ncbi:MAG TPA: hypothetical protein DCF72_13715 [Gammaproteobacteria bacterium]|nr:hypothetical protein [Gammaproteobacteria bacterium]